MSLSPRINPLPYLPSGFRQSHFWFVVIEPSLLVCRAVFFDLPTDFL